MNMLWFIPIGILLAVGFTCLGFWLGCNCSHYDDEDHRYDDNDDD